jgi:hypothetical protein
MKKTATQVTKSLKQSKKALSKVGNKIADAADVLSKVDSPVVQNMLSKLGGLKTKFTKVKSQVAKIKPAAIKTAVSNTAKTVKMASKVAKLRVKLANASPKQRVGLLKKISAAATNMNKFVKRTAVKRTAVKPASSPKNRFVPIKDIPKPTLPANAKCLAAVENSQPNVPLTGARLRKLIAQLREDSDARADLVCTEQQLKGATNKGKLRKEAIVGNRSGAVSFIQESQHMSDSLSQYEFVEIYASSETSDMSEMSEMSEM